MIKVEVSLDKLKNQVSIIHSEVAAAVNSNSDNERRDTLLRVSEMLKTLRASLSSDSVEIEVK